MIIAAIAGANDCVVVTDNEKDFAGVEILNPMRRIDLMRRRDPEGYGTANSIPPLSACRGAIRRNVRDARNHSHSIVPGGFEVMS